MCSYVFHCSTLESSCIGQNVSSLSTRRSCLCFVQPEHAYGFSMPDSFGQWARLIHRITSVFGTGQVMTTAQTWDRPSCSSCQYISFSMHTIGHRRPHLEFMCKPGMPSTFIHVRKPLHIHTIQWMSISDPKQRRTTDVYCYFSKFWASICSTSLLKGCVCMYLLTTVPHPHGHWQLQELLGNHIMYFIFLPNYRMHMDIGIPKSICTLASLSDTVEFSVAWKFCSRWTVVACRWGAVEHDMEQRSRNRARVEPTARD